LGGRAAWPVEVETGADAGGWVGGEVVPEGALMLVVLAFFGGVVVAKAGLERRGAGREIAIVGEGHGLAVLLDEGVDGLLGVFEVAHLAEGFEAGAHEGGHGGGLAGVDDAGGKAWAIWLRLKRMEW